MKTTKPTRLIPYLLFSLPMVLAGCAGTVASQPQAEADTPLQDQANKTNTVALDLITPPASSEVIEDVTAPTSDTAFNADNSEPAVESSAGLAVTPPSELSATANSAESVGTPVEAATVLAGGNSVYSVIEEEEEQSMSQLTMAELDNDVETMAHLYPTEPDITDTTPPQQVVFHFDTNSAEMTPTDLELIKEHARYLAANPAMSVLVNGHSDARGASQYNQQLSQRRAASVAELLIQYGALSEQIDTRAYGETIPVAEPENWYANRRVQLEYTDPVVITSSSK